MHWQGFKARQTSAAEIIDLIHLSEGEMFSFGLCWKRACIVTSPWQDFDGPA